MSRKKGNERERQARKIYEAAGYATEKSVGQRWGRSDFFHQFDLLAVRPDSIRFVQVKSGKAIGVNAMCEWVAEHGYEGAHHEYAIYHDGEGWRLVRVEADDYETVYDEREDETVGPHVDTEKNTGQGLAAHLAEGGA